MTNFDSASSTINTALNLGITFGALGLAFGFANRAMDLAQPRKHKKQNYIDYDYMQYRPKKSRKKQDIFDFGF